MQDQMQQILRRIKRESERSMNRSRRRNSDRITPVTRVSDGILPVDPVEFPGDESELQAMNGPAIDQLLKFYGLATQGSVGVRKNRLKDIWE